jgi:hypothetical protein
VALMDQGKEHVLTHVSLKALVVTEFNEIFLGRQPRQDVEVFRFGDQHRPHLQGVLVVRYHQN